MSDPVLPLPGDASRPATRFPRPPAAPLAGPALAPLSSLSPRPTPRPAGPAPVATDDLIRDPNETSVFKKLSNLTATAAPALPATRPLASISYGPLDPRGEQFGYTLVLHDPVDPAVDRARYTAASLATLVALVQRHLAPPA